MQITMSNGKTVDNFERLRGVVEKLQKVPAIKKSRKKRKIIEFRMMVIVWESMNVPN
jgi:hypothetical protein